jgi:hypothetical protein
MDMYNVFRHLGMINSRFGRTNFFNNETDGMNPAYTAKLQFEPTEAVYIGAIVKDHQKDLDEIDNKPMKDASNEDVKSHISATRGVIAKHLERAKEIQTEMGGKKITSTN